MRAAVLHETDKPLTLEDLDLEAPHAGEVRIEIAASGICRSDLSNQTGTLRTPLPVVLGHEAAGVVTELGAGVDTVAVGDRVVLSLSPECGECVFCTDGHPNLCVQMVPGMLGSTLLDGTTRLRAGDRPVHQICGVGSFAEEVVVSAGMCVPVPDDVPLERACLLGCCVITGAGAALNTPEVTSGGSVAVLGCGGVGLAAIQGARIAGAETIVAIDLDPAKLELARRLGATHGVQGEGDVRKAVRKLTGLGVHVAIEAIGTADTIATAWELVRPTGLVLVIGMPRAGERIPVRAGGFFQQKRIEGCVYGNAHPRRDLARLLEHVRRGELRLDPLVTDELPLARAQDGLDALARGDGVRSVIVRSG